MLALEIGSLQESEGNSTHVSLMCSIERMKKCQLIPQLLTIYKYHWCKCHVLEIF